MPVRYDQDTKAKAIRLVREHAGDYPSEYAAITAVARRLGMAPETLRKWIRQAAVDEGQAPGVSTEAAKEIRELKRKVSELERTIEILSAAASFFTERPRAGHRRRGRPSTALPGLAARSMSRPQAGHAGALTCRATEDAPVTPGHQRGPAAGFGRDHPHFSID
jgi:transposase